MRREGEKERPCGCGGGVFLLQRINSLLSQKCEKQRTGNRDNRQQRVWDKGGGCGVRARRGEGEVFCFLLLLASSGGWTKRKNKRKAQLGGGRKGGSKLKLVFSLALSLFLSFLVLRVVFYAVIEK